MSIAQDEKGSVFLNGKDPDRPVSRVQRVEELAIRGNRNIEIDGPRRVGPNNGRSDRRQGSRRANGESGYCR